MPHSAYQVLGDLSLQIELCQCLLTHLKTLSKDNDQTTKEQQKSQKIFVLVVFLQALASSSCSIVQERMGGERDKKLTN